MVSISVNRRVDLLGQILGVGVLVLEPIVLLPQSVPRRLLVGRHRHRVAPQLPQPEMVAVGEVGRDLDPLPPLGGHGLRLVAELLGRQPLQQRRVLQPAAVVALEQVAHHLVPPASS